MKNLCVILFCGLLFVACGKESTIESGTTGECKWTLIGTSESDRRLTLTISGNGKMDDYYANSYCPWSGYSDQITTVIITDGVTSIGENAFNNCDRVASVAIPGSVTSIGGGAFAYCGNLTSITIPGSVTSMGVGLFTGCMGLTVTPESFWKTGDSPLLLDGWNNEHYKVPIDGAYALLSFNFRDKYNELSIAECVLIDADGKRIHPIRQDGDDYTYDIKSVNNIDISSLHPGKAWTPFSQEITLNKMMFHK